MRYTLVRSRRKTLVVYITKDATVEVRAPLHTSKVYIDKFLASKEQWILKHLAKCEQNIIERTAFVLTYGDKILLRGKQYPIAAREGRRAGFDGECFFMPPNLPLDAIKRTVVSIYKVVAKSVLSAKAAKFAGRMAVSPTNLRITGAKTRWGSCSGKNSINFSWRLIMAVDDVIDYVVVHELAHIREHNHSPRFWSVVEGVLPDYEDRRVKLKHLQAILSAQDWD